MAQNDEELLSRFPRYNPKTKKGRNYVGTRDYWEGVFEGETNRNIELHTAFSKLHEDIVNEIITFCKRHNLTNVSLVGISIDGLNGSLDYGKWSPATDSSMEFYVVKKDETSGMFFLDRDKPFLSEI